MWDWEKFIKGGVLGVFAEPSVEVPGVAPPPYGYQPTGTQPGGEPIEEKKDKTALYIGVGVVALLVVVLLVLAVKGK